MELRKFTRVDVPAFLELAGSEGWISDPWEFAFLLETFPRGCLCAVEDGRAVAFVTSIRYGASGWIGNLLVEKGMRGRGYGTLLMERSLGELLAAGARTVWLTASPAGRPIYEKTGFREVDQVVRWHGVGKARMEESGDGIPVSDLVPLDRAGWGDERRALLSAVVARGTLLVDADGFLVVQRCGGGFQLGPWSCGHGSGASSLFARALGAVGKGMSVFLDVPAGNGGVAKLLHAAGFSITGHTSLMFAGETPAYEPSRIQALASMGSMG